jgi:hypothetical protein
MAVRCPVCGHLVATPPARVRSPAGIVVGLLVTLLGNILLIGALVANDEVHRSPLYLLEAMGIACLLVVFPILVWSSSRTENGGPGHQATGGPV